MKLTNICYRWIDRFSEENYFYERISMMFPTVLNVFHWKKQSAAKLYVKNMMSHQTDVILLLIRGFFVTKMLFLYRKTIAQISNFLAAKDQISGTFCYPFDLVRPTVST